MAAEKTLFHEGNVVVSVTRFVVEDAIYPINGITSVRMVKYSPNTTPGVIMLVVGVFAAMFFASFLEDAENNILPLAITLLFAAVMFGGGIYLCMMQKFAVEVTTAAGQERAITSSDRETISRIVKAISDAVVQRG